MVIAMARTVATAQVGGRTAGAGAGAVAHLMAPVAPRPMGAARALGGMTGARAPKRTTAMTIAVIHQEEASPPENFPSSLRHTLC